MSEQWEDPECDLNAAVLQLQRLVTPFLDISKIERIKLEPGEVLHVKFGVPLNDDQSQFIGDMFTKLFPNTRTFISDALVDVIKIEAIKDESK
jgi:hypothetical protein